MSVNQCSKQVKFMCQMYMKKYVRYEKGMLY